MGALSQEDKDSLFDDLFSISNLADGCDSADKILETPTLTIDLDSVTFKQLLF